LGVAPAGLAPSRAIRNAIKKGQDKKPVSAIMEAHCHA